MKKYIICLVSLLFFAHTNTYSQIATAIDNVKVVEVQLVSLKGDRRTGEIRPILKLRGLKDYTEIQLHQALAWNADGEILRAPGDDDGVYETVKISNGIWTKCNIGKWFRLYDPTRSVTSLSILRFPFTYNNAEYQYGDYYVDFIDVPVEWEEPEAAPILVANRLGVKSFDGVSHYFWTSSDNTSYGESRYLEGDVRLECISRDAKTGVTTLALQLKVDNPKEENGKNTVYVGYLKYIDDKGSYNVFKIDQYYSVQKGEWSEIEIRTTKAIFFNEATHCKWMQIVVKNDERMYDHVLTAYDVPIQTQLSTGSANNSSSVTTSNMCVMTRNGVGPLQLGKKMPLPTPQGTFYTSAKKSRTDGYTTDYDLYNGNIKVGTALVSNNTISQIEINKPCNVQLDNGIKIGSSLRETLGMPGVKVEIEYYYDIPDEPYSIGFKYNGVRFGTNSEKSGLTPQSAKKIKDSMMNGDPIFEFEPSDFKEDAKVNWFSISIY